MVQTTRRMILLASICVILMGFAVRLLPWVNFASDSAGAIGLLAHAPEVQPEVLDAVSRTLLPLIPIAAVIGGILAIWGLLDTRANYDVAVGMFVAGLSAGVYYGAYLIQALQSADETVPATGAGFWVALVGAGGLMLPFIVWHALTTFAEPLEIARRHATRAFLALVTLLGIPLGWLSRLVVGGIVFVGQRLGYLHADTEIARLQVIERLRVPAMLTPSVLIVVILFGGGLLVGLGQSFGYFPVIGLTDFTFDYYVDVLTDSNFFISLWLTFRIAFISTFLSCVLAVAFALVLRERFRGSRFMTFLFQVPIPIPHLVAATGIVLLVSQSGLLSRAAVELGITQVPRDFPVMVYDRAGTAIILTYLWKEIPFIGVVVLAVLQGVGPQYEEIARTLGANRWQRFRFVLLPLILPGLLSTSIIVFAFSFANYEIPFLLGVRHPTTLPVMAFENYQDPDLALRPQAMAVSVVLAVIAIILLVAYRRLARHAINP